MKSCDEMVSSLLERRELYNNVRRKRRKIITGISCAAFCAVVACSAFAVHNSENKAEILPESDNTEVSVTDIDNPSTVPAYDKKTDADKTEIKTGKSRGEAKTSVFEKKKDKKSEKEKTVSEKSSKSTTTEPTEKEKTTSKTKTNGNKTTGNSVGNSSGGTAILRLKNKINVSGELYYALADNPDATFRVSAVYRPATANIRDFTYKGKTLSEWAIESENEKIVPQKMYELLKWGDSLKYGEALYQTGAPSGEKWDKRLYEDKVAYFGEEMLGKYIVNGVFLREKLEKDIADYNDNGAHESYEQAYNAYMNNVLPKAEKKLAAKNIRCERKADNSGLIIYVTPKELENLPLDDLNSWYFSLAREKGMESVRKPYLYLCENYFILLRAFPSYATRPEYRRYRRTYQASYTYF